MPIMTWDNSLDIGVHDMNREHQDILDAMNAIYDAHQAGRKGGSINSMVAQPWRGDDPSLPGRRGVHGAHQLRGS